jgi:lipoate-protein ligase A
MARPWRLIVHGAGAGPWNMGADEALLASARARGEAALRLYRWSGPWLSLGYGQRLEPPRREACRAAGVSLVRRATGGRAVLHGADLTYAVVAPASWLPSGLRATYALIGGALEAALRGLGVAAERHADPGPAGAAFDCFASPAADELSAGGRKLVGSAQRRTSSEVLQHGSLRLAPDAPAARGAAGLTEGATSLRELGCEAAPEAVEAALVQAFAAALGACFARSDLRPDEVRAARQRPAEGPPSLFLPLPAGGASPGESQGTF